MKFIAIFLLLISLCNVAFSNETKCSFDYSNDSRSSVNIDENGEASLKNIELEKKYLLPESISHYTYSPLHYLLENTMSVTSISPSKKIEGIKFKADFKPLDLDGVVEYISDHELNSQFSDDYYKNDVVHKFNPRVWWLEKPEKNLKKVALRYYSNYKNIVLYIKQFLPLGHQNWFSCELIPSSINFYSELGKPSSVMPSLIFGTISGPRLDYYISCRAVMMDHNKINNVFSKDFLCINYDDLILINEYDKHDESYDESPWCRRKNTFFGKNNIDYDHEWNNYFNTEAPTIVLDRLEVFVKLIRAFYDDKKNGCLSKN